MKRIIGMLILALILAAVLPTEAYADTFGTQVITVSIPCTVTLSIGEHGTVMVNEKTYTGSTSIDAPVGTTLTYTFFPEKGYRLLKVTYGGDPVTDAVKDGAFTALPLTGHNELEVTFVKQSGLLSDSQGTNTGDAGGLGLWVALMLASGTGVIVLMKKQKNRKCK